jgi:hypothetical protein
MYVNTCVSVFNPPRSTYETRHVFRATFGSDHIRFLFAEWDGDKKPRFFKGPCWFLSLLSIPIKYIFTFNQRRAGRGRFPSWCKTFVHFLCTLTPLRCSQIFGGPQRIRSRTCEIVDFHGLGASNHHVAPASANAATLFVSPSRDRPVVVPNCTMSNGAALLRYFEMRAHTSRIWSTVRSA